jgi:Flp pilus assembly protein CpaB
MKTSSIIYGAIGAAVVGGVGYYGYRYYKRSSVKSQVVADAVKAGTPFTAEEIAAIPVPQYVGLDDVSVTSTNWDKAFINALTFKDGQYLYSIAFQKAGVSIGTSETVYTEADIASGQHSSWPTFNPAVVRTNTSGAFAGAAIQVLR